MSQQARPPTCPQLDITNPLDAFIDAVLGREPTWQVWTVLVCNRRTGEEGEHAYLATSPDEAETMAHHEAVLRGSAGHYFVQALGVVPRRVLWDVRLQGRAQLRQALPAGIPLLIGRVVAASDGEARQQALGIFGRAQASEASDVAWRFVEPGDLFTVTRS